MDITKIENDSHFDEDEFFERIDKDKSIFTSLLEISFKQIQKDVDLLTDSIDKEDKEKVQGLAHKIKGACRTVSFNRLSKYCEEIELAADDGIIPDNAKSIVKEEWEIVSAIVKDILDKQS